MIVEQVRKGLESSFEGFRCPFYAHRI